MKKLFFIIGLFFSLSAMAQPTNYTKINMRYRWLSGMFDSALYVPRYNGTPSGVRVNETSAIDGMIAMDTTNNRLYIYSGGSWIRLAAYTEITGGNLYVDSLWRTPGVDSIFWLKNGITYKLKDSTGGGGVNIYNSDGTLTGNRLVSANNNSFQIDSFSTIGFFGKSANPSSVLTRKNIYTFNSDDSGLDGIYLQTFQNGGIGKTRIELKNEDINIDATETISINTQDSADVIIGKLPSGSSTDSVLVWTAGTGQVKKRNVSSLVSQTLQTVTTNGNTTTNSIQLGSVNPLLSLKQATSNEEWKIRVGVGTGIASQVFNIYNETSGKHLITGNGNRVIIGNPTNAFDPSTVYIKSYSSTGTNLDVQPDSTIFDEGNIEIMASDYSDGKGIAMRQWGNVGVAATAMGYHKKNMALLDFTENFNLIRTSLNRSLRFGTNNIERMVLDSNGRLGIGLLSPTAWLEVQDNNGAIATAIFSAHEDRSGEIVNVQQAGVKKFSFNTTGAIEMQEQSSAPSTPASGYVSVYANSSNSQLYLKNDAATEKQLITSVNLVFGAGGGADADTTAFSTSALYGSFYNDADTIVVTSMRGVLQGTSPSVTYQVWYNDSLNVEAGGTKLVTAGNSLTNTTTGTNVTSFDKTKIPPGVWVWVKTSVVTTKPKYFSLTINGYRK